MPRRARAKSGSASELVAQRELDHTRIARRLDLPEGGAAQVGYGSSESDLVEGIEELRPELELAETFTDRKALDQGDVRIGAAGSAEQVASSGAVLARLIRQERGGVEIPGDHVVPAGKRTNRIPDEIGPVKADAGQRVIATADDIDGQSGGLGNQAGEGPAAECLVYPTLAAQERDLVEEREAEHLTLVLIGAGAVGAIVKRVLRCLAEVLRGVIIEQLSERVGGHEGQALAE